MAYSHNCLLRGLNAILLQGPHVPSSDQEGYLAADVKDLLYYIVCWVKTVEWHHYTEEDIMFPGIEKLAGEPGLMSGPQHQHEEFHDGLIRLREHASGLQNTPENCRWAEIKAIIDGFAPSLTTHLYEEIDFFLTFERLDSDGLRKCWDAAEEVAKAKGKISFLYDIFPCVLGCADKTYEGGNQFPPLPGFMPYAIKYWFGAYKPGAWRFNPCDFWGTPKPLGLLPENRSLLVLECFTAKALPETAPLREKFLRKIIESSRRVSVTDDFKLQCFEMGKIGNSSEMAKKAERPLKINGLYVFPISLPAQPLLPPEHRHALHYMYLQPHEPKIADAATPRSLFIANVPFDSTTYHLRHLFSTQVGLAAGRIEGIDFHDRDEPYTETLSIAPNDGDGAVSSTAGSRKRKRAEKDIMDSLPSLDVTPLPMYDRKIHRPGTNAVVRFVDRTSMEAALSAARTLTRSGASEKIVWGGGMREEHRRNIPPLGSNRYRRHEQLIYPGNEVMREQADEWLAAYDAHIAARERILREQRHVPDADGFVTVTRTSSKIGGGGGGVRGVKHEVAKERLEKQNKKKEGLTDFYRFQERERHKARAKELVNQFQGDVEKARKIREKRGKANTG